MSETPQERRERLSGKFSDDVQKWVVGSGPFPPSKFKMIEAGPGIYDSYKVYQSYDDFLNG